MPSNVRSLRKFGPNSIPQYFRAPCASRFSGSPLRTRLAIALSGAPLRRRSTEIINYISRATNGRLPIIGVGGITDAASAGEKLDAGATLVQLYTGLIYRGPFFAAAVARALADRQQRQGG